MVKKEPELAEKIQKKRQFDLGAVKLSKSVQRYERQRQTVIKLPLFTHMEEHEQN